MNTEFMFIFTIKYDITIICLEIRNPIHPDVFSEKSFFYSKVVSGIMTSFCHSNLIQIPHLM